MLIALSLGGPQRLLRPEEDDTALVSVSGPAPDTDAFSGVSRSPDEPERHNPSPSPPAKNQTGQTRWPDLFVARPRLDRTKHVGRRELQNGPNGLWTAGYRGAKVVSPGSDGAGAIWSAWAPIRRWPVRRRAHRTRACLSPDVLVSLPLEPFSVPGVATRRLAMHACLANRQHTHAR